MPISLPQKASLAAHRLPQRTILACTRPVLVGHAVELATAHHLPRRRPSPNRNLRWPSTASRSWTQRATTPTPAIPAIGLSAHRRAPGPHSGRTQRTRQRTDTGRPHRTPTPDPGQRTPGRSDGTGHWTPVAGTGKRGHWTLAPDTGHRTLDAGRGRGQGDDGTAGIRTSWAATPSDRTLGRPTVFLWTAPAGARQPMQARR
jgi:hypothetical protein